MAGAIEPNSKKQKGKRGLEPEGAALVSDATQIEPRQVIQLLAQGPFTQSQTAHFSSEEKKAALPRLLQYAQATVEGVQQQFVQYANAVTGKGWKGLELP